MSTPTDNKIPTRGNQTSDLAVYCALAIPLGAVVTCDTANPPIPGTRAPGVKLTSANTDIAIGIINAGEGGNEAGPSSGIPAASTGSMRCIGAGTTMWAVADGTIAYGDPVMPATSGGPGRVLTKTAGNPQLGICIGPTASHAQGVKVLILLGVGVKNA